MADYTKELQEYREREIKVYKRLNLEDVNTVLNILEEARRTNKRIFICGNGGSAATASHYAVDFNKGVSEKLDMKYNFECLSDNIPTMMAVANDISYDEVFRFPLRNKMRPGDILIGISGSGNSTNVVHAFDFAKEVGGTVIAIVGYDGGRMKDISDYCIHIDINDMQISEDLHMILDHMMMWVLTHRACENHE